MDQTYFFNYFRTYINPFRDWGLPMKPGYSQAEMDAYRAPFEELLKSGHDSIYWKDFVWNRTDLRETLDHLESTECLSIHWQIAQNPVLLGWLTGNFNLYQPPKDWGPIVHPNYAQIVWPFLSFQLGLKAKAAWESDHAQMIQDCLLFWDTFPLAAAEPFFKPFIAYLKSQMDRWKAITEAEETLPAHYGPIAFQETLSPEMVRWLNALPPNLKEYAWGYLSNWLQWGKWLVGQKKLQHPELIFLWDNAIPQIHMSAHTRHTLRQIIDPQLPGTVSRSPIIGSRKNLIPEKWKIWVWLLVGVLFWTICYIAMGR